MNGKHRPMDRETKMLLLGVVIGAMLTGVVVLGWVGIRSAQQVAARKVGQRKADEIRSMTYLRGIGQGMLMYASNNGDTFPPAESWEQLLLDGDYIIPEMLTSPIEDGDGVSYIYVPGPYSLDTNQILAYEDPKHLSDGVYVVFADTRTEKIGLADFQRILADQLALQDPDPHHETP